MPRHPLSRSIRILPLAAIIISLISLAGCRAKKTAVGGDSFKPAISADAPSSIAGQAAGNTLPDATRRLLEEADRWMGTPYSYGAADRGRGTDCSGFVMTAFANALALKLPRSSREQQQWCAPVKGGVREAIPGDLVFFTTGKKGRVSHVGIYLGAGRVVHASTSKGVIVSDLTEPYYTRTYHSTGRVERYYAMLDTAGCRDTRPVRPRPAAPADTATDAGWRLACPPATARVRDARPVRPQPADTTLSPDKVRRLLLQRLAETDTLTPAR